jgi:hypothetical protein
LSFVLHLAGKRSGNQMGPMLEKLAAVFGSRL